jgi:hypothetical protein
MCCFRTDDKDANRSGASNLHQFYITTKVGPINVKAGDFYSASSEKQQCAGGHVAPLIHIIPIPSQQVLLLNVARVVLVIEM